MQQKLLFLLSICLPLATYCKVPKNRVSLSINSLNYNYTSVSEDTIYKNRQKSVIILPILGYQHIVKNNIGYGLEFGSPIASSNQKTYNYTISNSFAQTIERSSSSRTFYISPNAFCNFEFNNYIVQFSVSFPVEWTSQQKSNLKQDGFNFITLNSSEIIETETEPQTLNVGLLGNIAINKKIWGQLHIGAQLGVGISNKFGLGNRSRHTKVFTNNTLTSDETIITNYQKNKIGYLDFKPNIILSYTF